MPWSQAELRTYQESGFLLARGLLAPAEIDRLNAEMPWLLSPDLDDHTVHRERERPVDRGVADAHDAIAPHQ